MPVKRNSSPSVPAPPYTGADKRGGNLGLAVESMKRHTTNEGWELFAGMKHAGYRLCGFGLDDPSTDVGDLLRRYDPSVVAVQDKGEWEGLTAGPGFDQRERFRNAAALRPRADVFKLTVLKDAQSRIEYNKAAAAEIGCHAWIVYYLPSRVARIAPFVRERHLVRTYHTVDRDAVPPFDSLPRKGCLLSGAVSVAYPLRQRLFHGAAALPETTVLKHPGYGRTGTHTPAFLGALSGYKVAICTASKYGYALRKIVEATACGCRVITDLPEDDCLPGIDRNLIRVPSTAPVRAVGAVVERALDEYDPAVQAAFAETAITLYDYRNEGVRLAAAIEHLRNTYQQ